MDRDNFWVHKDHFSGASSLGQFSVPHLIWIAIVVALIAALVILYRNVIRSQQYNIRKVIALTLVGMDIFKLCTMALTGAPVAEYLPLEICSIASYMILLDALWPESKFFSPLLVLLFLPAAIMALLFPTVIGLPPINFYTIHQFIYHGLIVAYALSLYVNKEVKLSYGALWMAILKIFIIALGVYYIDIKFNKTFMFLTDPYGNPVLSLIWNITGGGRMYTIGLVLFVIVVLHIFYFIFKMIDKLRR